MKLCRFYPLESAGAEVRGGIVEGDRVREIHGELWGARELTGREWAASAVKFMPPSAPTKIVCVGKNYSEHAAEMGGTPPKEPLIFLKPSSAVLPPGGQIVLPRISERVDYEGELGVIIGRRCSQVQPGEPTGGYILGYTCLNDVTARDLQKRDGQWTRGKGFDTFCPFGPVLETELDLAQARVESSLNGTRKQSAPLTEMIFSVDAIIRWIAQVMTLQPGDVIATGTPAGVGPMAAGDVVEVTVSGVGTLRNEVVAAR
ncbi:MAG TPA: fumarylacetoacetate hydrolase family protein [Candidatus Acidoferrales bacterium]|nr:fumarylacetoacetate hydrolase family protein [Candidatus Acidoferrales bacterium]